METPVINNPASVPATKAAEATRKRIPMSIPRRKMEVPEISGWFLYWHLEKNVPAAIQAGYEFVDSGEVSLHQVNVATLSSLSGSADLGSRVRISAGIGEDGQPSYHVLMKLRQEWRDEDQKAIDERNAGILSGIFNKETILDGSNQVSAEDRSTRYVKKALFQRPARK